MPTHNHNPRLKWAIIGICVVLAVGAFFLRSLEMVHGNVPPPVAWALSLVGTTLGFIFFPAFFPSHVFYDAMARLTDWSKAQRYAGGILLCFYGLFAYHSRGYLAYLWQVWGLGEPQPFVLYLASQVDILLTFVLVGYLMFPMGWEDAQENARMSAITRVANQRARLVDLAVQREEQRVLAEGYSRTILIQRMMAGETLSEPEYAYLRDTTIGHQPKQLPPPVQIDEELRKQLMPPPKE